MNQLCLDTHGQFLTMTIGDGFGIQASHSQPANGRHSELLVTVLDDLLSLARKTRNDLEWIAVVNGPGSFTGLRVGLSFVKGLALGRGYRLVALNSLEALAHSAEVASGWLSPVIDAKKNQIYAALYERVGRNLRMIKEPVAVEPSEWIRKLPEGTRLLGSGVDLCRTLLVDPNRSNIILEDLKAPTPYGLYQLALRKYRAEEFVTPEGLDALYLRPADAVLKIGNR